MISKPVAELARRRNIALTLKGLDGVTRDVPDSTVRHLLEALGITAGTEREIARSLSQSKHHAPLKLEAPKGARCYLPDWLLDSRAWGISMQLYELRSTRNWGIGDFADLAEVAETFARAGADFIGLNPLHALFLATPERCSPFSPSNRRFLNPIYIAIDHLPGFTGKDVDNRALNLLRQKPLVDYPAVADLKLRTLRHLWADWKEGRALPEGYRRETFHRFAREGGEALLHHALFEALSFHMVSRGFDSGWHSWPDPYRDIGSRQVADFERLNNDEVQFHIWLQWLANMQLRQAAERARSAGMRIGLYFDFAVGEAPDGSASWSDPGVAVRGVTIGAPPDLFTAKGQDWGLAPASPDALSRNGAAKFRAMMDAAMEGSGALRIDHVMALWQLFLIPHGSTPAQGAYLRYPITELLGALAECSDRNETIVIGEDLGNVPRGFREVMRRVRVLSYRILYFEKNRKGFLTPDAYPKLALACLSTHDLPTFRAWWRGDDIVLRTQYELIDAEAEKLQTIERTAERRALVKSLQACGALRGNDKASSRRLTGEAPRAVIVASHRYIARTPCLLAAARLADLAGEVKPANLPGTAGEHPNWRRKISIPIEELDKHSLFRDISEAMRSERGAAS